MSTPWFDPMAYAWLGGTFIGIAAGVDGTLMGLFASRGKCKGLVLTLHFGVLAVSIALLGAGLVAVATGQPYGVWYGLFLPGAIGSFVLGMLTRLLLAKYREAELRKSLASDL